MNDKMLWDNIDDLRLISQKLQEQITLLTSKVEEIEERISGLEQQSEAQFERRRRWVRKLELGFTIREVAEIMNFGTSLVRDYYNNYRNLTKGTNLYVHPYKKKSLWKS